MLQSSSLPATGSVLGSLARTLTGQSRRLDPDLSRSRTITSLWLERTRRRVVDLPTPPARVQEACGNVAGFLRLARSVRWVRPARRTVPPLGRPGRHGSHQAPHGSRAPRVAEGVDACRAALRGGREAVLRPRRPPERAL